MFANCGNFNSDFSKWNVRKVNDMKSMFYYCSSFKGFGLENWKVNSIVKNYYYGIFDKCDSLIKYPSWYK